ncbi:FAD-dependent oxidoreductase [Rariglobus hedericola]|uniref:FAD-dependent oxidoreductase n=1 Tax=Rariglobus hedericola TaxID=2597822 RepID=A0A556QRP9_9BACT|nr:FAD-dependent oxidoreductase [Rariglobus hedericola]TSJ79303.1 FAD-dependent oxidoreductase [Rariglobus hedericola]
MNQNSRFYEEPARSLPVIAECDVLVIGGGPGGIGAAVAAARNGAKTILVERFGSFGGTWTAGLLSAIMPYPFVKGLFLELVERWTQAGGWNTWGDKYGAGGSYDSEAAKVVLDRFIVDAGITPFFFAQATAVIREGSRLTGVIIESKEGRQVIRAKMIIDSSGDGDVSALAGVPVEQGRAGDGAVQPMSMLFKMTGVDDEALEAYRKIDLQLTTEWQAAKARGEVTVPREDVLLGRNPRAGEWNFNTTRIVNKDGTKLRDVTDAMIEGRRQVFEVAAFLRKRIPGFANAVVSETAPHIGVRETRRVRCDYTITADDIMGVLPVEDCIARGNWFIDIHSPTGEGTERAHPPAGSWYEIPYRSIRAQGLDNLLVASRCIDSSHEAHAAIRITPQVMAIGEGAGTAAALAVAQGHCDTRQVDVKLLRDTLRTKGAFV